MKTDAFFHTIFKRDPALLLELVGLPTEDEYDFESVEVKQTHKRIDGLLRARHGRGPNIFVEFQAYKDPAIYWRTYREVSVWYEQNAKSRVPGVVVILFLDRSLDPGPPDVLVPAKLIRAYLPECLARLRARAGGERPSPLVVFEPLVLQSDKALPMQAERWVRTLEDLNLSEKDRTFWLEQLEYAVVQRFPSLTLEEIRAMLQLTPLEETVAGKQLIAIGMDKGLRKGELVGEIRTYQRILRLPVTPRDDLIEQPEGKLRRLLSDLQARL